MSLFVLFAMHAAELFQLNYVPEVMKVSSLTNVKGLAGGDPGFKDTFVLGETVAFQALPFLSVAANFQRYIDDKSNYYSFSVKAAPKRWFRPSVTVGKMHDAYTEFTFGLGFYATRFGYDIYYSTRDMESMDISLYAVTQKFTVIPVLTDTFAFQFDVSFGYFANKRVGMPIDDTFTAAVGFSTKHLLASNVSLSPYVSFPYNYDGTFMLKKTKFLELKEAEVGLNLYAEF